jgi:hypothetical protein
MWAARAYGDAEDSLTSRSSPKLGNRCPASASPQSYPRRASSSASWGRPCLPFGPSLSLPSRLRLHTQDLVHDGQRHTKSARNRHRLHTGMVRGLDQTYPSRRNSSSRMELSVPASRSRCCGCRLKRGSLSGIWARTGRTAALDLAVDADPQRLEIIIAQKLQCLREVFRQRDLGSIRQASSRRRLISLWRRRLNIWACWPGRSHHLQRMPHGADCSNVQTATQPRRRQGHAEPWKYRARAIFAMP